MQYITSIYFIHGLVENRLSICRLSISRLSKSDHAEKTRQNQNNEIQQHRGFIYYLLQALRSLV